MKDKVLTATARYMALLAEAKAAIDAVAEAISGQEIGGLNGEEAMASAIATELGEPTPEQASATLAAISAKFATGGDPVAVRVMARVLRHQTTGALVGDPLLTVNIEAAHYTM